MVKNVPFQIGICCIISAVFCSGGATAELIVQKLDASAAFILHQREIYFEVTDKSAPGLVSDYGDYVTVSSAKFSSSRVKKGILFKKNVYQFTFDQLSEKGQRKAIDLLFPKDHLIPEGWEHSIVYTGEHGETLWRLSKWFSGTENNANEIIKYNKINPSRLKKGDRIVIPAHLLSKAFQTEPATPIKPLDPTAPATESLVFKKDSGGKYAESILHQGQTIYSDIVLKFTPRVTVQEVMEAATMILNRSKLSSFNDIPAGTHLKIPIELLSPQFLPSEDPLRIQYEMTSEASKQYKHQSKSDSLKGITIVLDAGHGGIDPGAIGPGKEREDEYAYDVMCRVKLLLEATTQSIVYATISDGETGFIPRSMRFLPSGRNVEKIMTHPAYQIKDTQIALNLRWLLANDIFTQSIKSKQSNESILFTSFHADCLHEDVKGMMIYTPGADYYQGNCQLTDSHYKQYRESRSGLKFKISRGDRLRAEGYSHQFANCITQMCRKLKIPMHSNQPVRKYIIRSRNPWVPAVLKYCRIPTRVLIELANLKNTQDRENLRNPMYRQKIAEAYVESVRLLFKNSN